GHPVAAVDGVYPVERVVAVADGGDLGAAAGLGCAGDGSGRVVPVGGDRAGDVGGGGEFAVEGVLSLGAGAVRILHRAGVTVGVVLVRDLGGRVVGVVDGLHQAAVGVVRVAGFLRGSLGAAQVLLGELPGGGAVGVGGDGAGRCGDGLGLASWCVGVG